MEPNWCWWYEESIIIIWTRRLQIQFKRRLKANALRVKKTKLVHIHYIIEERRRNTTGRSGVLVGRWRSNPQVVGSLLASALSFSHVDVGDAFQFINHIYRRFASRQRIVLFAAKSVAYVWKKKGWRGANPRPMVLNASALPLHHSDLMFHVYHIIAEKRPYTTGRSGVGVGRWRSKP